MTEGAKGDPLGDGGVTISPSPPGGKFWCLASEDEEESPVARSVAAPASEAYWQSSPVVSSPSSRYVKRMRSRAFQRRAAMLLASSPSVSRESSPELCRRPPRTLSPPAKDLILPVLEPTIFFLDDFIASEWITVVRKSAVSRFRLYVTGCGSVR